jgi:hypothetical protein
MLTRDVVQTGTKVYLAKDGVSEVMGPGYKEDRNIVATLIDPFDLYGLVRGKDNKTRFWENDGVSGGDASATGKVTP